MSKGPTTLGTRLRQLMALAGSKNEQERLGAMRAIDALLEKHRKSWGDLTDLMAGKSNDPIWNVVDGEDQS